MYNLSVMTLRELLVKSSKEYAPHTALADIRGNKITYRRLGTLAFAVSEKLMLKGYRQGDKIGLLSENSIAWGIAYLGITAAGYTVVPILPDFGEDSVKNILIHAECRAVFASPSLKTKTAGLPENIAVFPLEEAGFPEKLLDEGGDLDKRLPPVSEGELAAIIYTSGTTGNSKGVMLSHKNIVWDAWATRSIIKLNTRDRLLSVLPLAHTYECTIGFIGPLLQGCSIFYLDRPPSATVLLPALKMVRPTAMLTVPLLIEKTVRAKVFPELNKIGLYRSALGRKILHLIAGLKLKKQFGGKLRFFGIGGAALAPDVEKFLSEARFPYAIGYGLTETAPLIAGSAPFRTTPRSTGPALRGVSLRIDNPDPKTGEGEIQAFGPNLMMGYYKDPEKTKETFTEDGWFKTGDLGVFDSKNRLSIRGRSKNMILGPSGENIYPEEIESLLNQSAYVQESLVYEEENSLVALVHLKPEILETIYGDLKDLAADMKEKIENTEARVKELLETLRKDVNQKVSAFSRLGKVNLQAEPFEKTPTQKIKRYLYNALGKKRQA